MTGSATASRGNLPSELTSFIGRRHLLQEVKSALSGARMVTLVGPGGVGKTRLAVRAATDLSRGIADGAWLVELAGLREPELVTKAVMTSLGLRDESSQWPVSRLIDYLGLEAAAARPRQLRAPAGRLLRCSRTPFSARRPALRILATSRQPLGVVGETVVQVGPLSIQTTTGEEAPERSRSQKRSPCWSSARGRPEPRSR